MAKAKGRPTKYSPVFVEVAKVFVRSGHTLQELAEALQISIDTLFEWRKKHVDFSEAVNGAITDRNKEVENSLFNRATGRVKVREVKLLPNENGKMVPVAQVIKELPPDFLAQKFWLMNTAPDKWRTPAASEPESILETLTDEELERIAKSE